MQDYRENKNLFSSVVISLLLTLLCTGFTSLQAQQDSSSSAVDSLLAATGKAREIVDDLLRQEDHQHAMMDSLRQHSMLDSVIIANLIRRQNEQKGLLINLEKQTYMANENHKKLISEIDKIKPRYSDLLVPVGGGILGAAFFTGSVGEKVAFGILIYGTILTLKHFGVY